MGQIEIGTGYIPPRVGYLHYPDFFKLFYKNRPVYFIGDLNGRSRTLGYGNTNAVGQQLDLLMDRGHLRHEGPHFPTFISNRSQTTPDVILTNKYTVHNTYAEQGPLVTSVHTPIVHTISSSPIQIAIRPRLSFKQANWEGYKHILGSTPVDDILRNKHELNEALNRWTTQIQATSKTFIPEVTHRTLPGVRTTEKLTRLHNLHKQIYNLITQSGSSSHRSRMLNKVRKLLREEYVVEQSRLWDEIINGIDQDRREDFWKSIKRIWGKKEVREVSYLRNADGEDVHGDEEKA